MEPLIWPCLEKGKERRKEGMRESKKEKKEKIKKMKKKKKVQRRYKEPRWVENRKAIHAKIRGILLGRGPRQKLGIQKKKFIHLNLVIWEGARERLKGLLKAKFKHRISKNKRMA